MIKTDYQYEVIFRLRRIREKLGISQSKVACILGLSNGQVGNIETPNQLHKYTLAQIETLCNEFDVPIESIFFGENSDLSNISTRQLIHKIVLYLN